MVGTEVRRSVWCHKGVEKWGGMWVFPPTRGTGRIHSSALRRSSAWRPGFAGLSAASTGLLGVIRWLRTGLSHGHLAFRRWDASGPRLPLKGGVVVECESDPMASPIRCRRNTDGFWWIVWQFGSSTLPSPSGGGTST